MKWHNTKVLAQYWRKTVLGEKVYVIKVHTYAKQQAKQIKEDLSKLYNCVVEVNNSPYVYFDKNTGREYTTNGLLSTFSVFLARKKETNTWIKTVKILP